MKKLFAAIMFVVCTFILVGRGPVYADSSEGDKGIRHAEEKYRKDVAQIRRAESNESFGRDLHIYLLFMT